MLYPPYESTIETIEEAMENLHRAIKDIQDLIRFQNPGRRINALRLGTMYMDSAYEHLRKATQAASEDPGSDSDDSSDIDQAAPDDNPTQID